MIKNKTCKYLAFKTIEYAMLLAVFILLAALRVSGRIFNKINRIGEQDV